MIRAYSDADFETVYQVINDSSQAYKGIIPDDRWNEPYMTKEELRSEIKDGIQFYCYVDKNEIIGVMGIQNKDDVNLIRHAYIKTTGRRKGIGGQLLEYLQKMSSIPLLIGTWADASWAIHFYEKHGFYIVPQEKKDKLLRKYWNITERQVETSVVLAQF